jgi:hypothetical protein
VVEELTIGLAIVLLRQIEVAVLKQALRRQQVERLIAGYGCAPARPDIDRELIDDYENEEEGDRAEENSLL